MFSGAINKGADDTLTVTWNVTFTGAVVVADDTAMTKVSTGCYRHTFTEPAFGLTYTYWVEYVYDGKTYREEKTAAGADARICTVADVKDRLGETGGEYDAMISRIVLGLEGIFDNHIARELIAPAADVTEYYTGCGPHLQLRRYPVIAVTSIKEAVDYNFDDVDALVENDAYRLVNAGKNGILFRIYGWWFDTPDATRIIYRGGYCAAGVSPGSGETALPDDIREAAIAQATFLFKRRDDLVIALFDRKHPGDPLECDDIYYTGDETAYDSPRQCLIEMRFEVSKMTPVN